MTRRRQRGQRRNPHRDRHSSGRRSGHRHFTPVSGATAIFGLYGTLTINPDGTYSYVVDNDNAHRAAPERRSTVGRVLQLSVTDTGGLDDVAQLRIVIQGANDNPVASDDAAEAQAASTNGNAPESNPTGNVILFPSRPGPSTNRAAMASTTMSMRPTGPAASSGQRRDQ